MVTPAGDHVGHVGTITAGGSLAGRCSTRWYQCRSGNHLNQTQPRLRTTTNDGDPFVGALYFSDILREPVAGFAERYSSHPLAVAKTTGENHQTWTRGVQAFERWHSRLTSPTESDDRLVRKRSVTGRRCARLRCGQASQSASNWVGYRFRRSNPAGNGLNALNSCARTAPGRCRTGGTDGTSRSWR